MAEKVTLRTLTDEDFFTGGHTACPGCGAATLARVVMKVLGPDTVVYLPANCMLVFSSTYPHNAFKVPYHHVLFENSAVCAAAISRALRRRGHPDTTVVAFAGDGGTADIGIQALSGAAERNEDILYFCYDNEAYMNTGIQRSGATPLGAWTTTTPVGELQRGKAEFKKDVPQIVAAHGVPYVATASIGFPNDLLAKLQKAKEIRGFRYLHVFAPCPTGWRAESDQMVELAKLAVDTGMFPLYEVTDGAISINREPRFTPLKQYLDLQGRFRHLAAEEVATLEAGIRERWDRLVALERATSSAWQAGG